MIERYEVFVEVGTGTFVRAPDPPPPDWRERKGVCRRCGEKVFVKAGPIRSFWTHGKGKTCVPKPNPVAEAIDAAEYAKNRGASTEGDEALKARFADCVGEPPAPPPAEERIRPEGVSDEEWQGTQAIFGGRGGDEWSASDADEPQAAVPPARDEPAPEPSPPRRVVIWPTPVDGCSSAVRSRPDVWQETAQPQSEATAITYAVSLGWVEASLVMGGYLNRVKDVVGMPPKGTFGRIAIHYMTDFPRSAYDEHVRHALRKYPGCEIPPYEEIDRQRKSYYWGLADFAVVEEEGTAYIKLAGVVRPSTLVHRISEGRKVWPLGRFDARMIG